MNTRLMVTIQKDVRPIRKDQLYRRKASKMILRGGEIFLARKERGKVLVSTAILLI